MSDIREQTGAASEGPTGGPGSMPERLAESLDISQREDVPKLRKHAIGLWGVVFLTVTGAAPISAMLFNTPISVGFGNGVGTPSGFAFAAIVLTIFSVGYVAMARKKTTAGGFYSYISHGLGREIGMGTGFGAVLAYSVFEVSLISILAWFDVRLSTIVLAGALISEVIILVIFDLVMFVHGGLPLAALNPVNAFKGFPATGGLVAGAAGIGIFFAFWSWVGFEMAPNYGEESRNPKKIVPRAMYISVIGLGVFYTLTSWAPFAGYSSVHAAQAQAQNNSAEFYLGPANAIAGHWVGSIMSFLIITGSFACGMAFHNTSARYFYSLGREGLLPRALGKTHHRWKSPHIASVTQSVIAALIVLGFAVFVGTGDPLHIAYLQVYGLMAVMGVIIILAVQALVSLSILIYFTKEHPDDVHWWKTMLAPGISFIAQVVVIYLLFKNILFLGSGYHY